MKKMNPSVMVFRLDLEVLELAAARCVFSDSSRISGIFENLQASEAVDRGPEEGTTHQGTLGDSGAPWWIVVSIAHLSGTSLADWVSSGPKKISKKFRRDWTPFGIDILRSKKQAKTITGTLALCQQVSPKK